MANLSYQQDILRELADAPARVQREVLDFLLFLKNRTQPKPDLEPVEAFPTHLLSEEVLAKDWLTAEEDEAWRDL